MGFWLRAAAVALSGYGLSGCALPGPVGPAQVFQQAGLLGTWAPNCRRPASPANPYATWTADGTGVAHSVDFGPRRPRLVDTVGTARILQPGLTEFTTIRDGQLALTVTVRERDGHLSAERSVGADGRVYYDHGIQLSNGRPALVDERCLTVAVRE